MTYQERYGVVYKFHRERAGQLSNTEAFWNETARMMTELSMQYKDVFIDELLLVAYGELERMVAK